MMNITTANISVDLDLAAKLGLTERQAESAAWAAEGKVDEEIGMIIGRTARTAKNHILNAMGQTDTHTRAQLVAKLFMNGVFASKTAVVAMALIACLFATLALDPTDSTQMARRVRSRRGRDYAALEEADDLPEWLEMDFNNITGAHA